MRRAEITGLGAVTPVGNDVPSTWEALVAGRSGVAAISRFDASDYPVTIAAEVKGFDPAGAMSAKEVRKTGLDVHYGVAAATEAFQDSGFTVDGPSRVWGIIRSAVRAVAKTLREEQG